MLEVIFLSPLILVILGSLFVRYRVRRRPMSASGYAWIGCCIASAVTLPLLMGVWIPDFLGFKNTVGKVTASTGHEISVVQSWNYIDFYTTSVIVRSPDGREDVTTLDWDDDKSWNVPITLNESARIATVTLSGGREKTVPW